MSGDTPKRRITTRKRSLGSPLMVGRERGVWHPDLVGKIRGYPRTLETFVAKQTMMAQQSKLYHAEGIARRNGVPDGWSGRKAELKQFRANARDRAERIVAVMAEETHITDPRAIKAMTNAVEIFETRDSEGIPVFKAADRISAIRVVLDFTTPKPAQKQDISVSRAEDWLAGLAAKSG